MKTKINKSFVNFSICFIIAVVTTFLISQPDFTDSQNYVIFLLIFSIGLWFTEAIPAFAVSLFIIAFLVFALGNKYFNSAPQKIDIYVNTFSSSVIWLMLGGFFIASAMTKTKLDESLLRFTFRISGTKPKNILIGLMATTMFASMFTSNTATTAMVVASLTPLLISLGKNSKISKALLLGVPIAASTGGIATIIGSPPNAIAVGAMENAGIEINFLEWMIYGFPIAIFLTALSCFVLIKYYLKDTQPLSTEFINTPTENFSPELKRNRKIVIAVLLVTVLFWLTGEWHGISVAAITAIPLVFFTLSGIITSQDVRGLPWGTLLLVAGGLSLGLALQHTGLLNYYSGQITSMGLQPLTYIFILAYLSMIFSNVMSHTATSTVLIPLGLVILSGFQKDISLIIAFSCSTALFLPVSTPPNAIAYSTGFIEQKDFRLGGLLVGFLGPLLIILWVRFLSGVM